MPRDFSSLHNHSFFSFQDAISSPEELVVAAKEKGLRSIALTDHGVAHGVADFYLAGKKHGVRTVYGVESYAVGSLKEWQEARDRILAERKARRKGVDVDEQDVDVEAEAEQSTTERRVLKRRGHLVVLASSLEGLSNLYRLVHRSHRDGFYTKPRIDKAMLQGVSRGLLGTSACIGGVVANKLWEHECNECEWKDVVAEAMDYDAIFGHGRFFLELQFNEIPQQRRLNLALIALSRETGIPLTVGTDSHYVERDDWEVKDVLYMLRAGTSMKERGPDWQFADRARELFLKSGDESWESYERFDPTLPKEVVEEAFAGTLALDGLVEAYEPDTRQRLPTLPYPDVLKELGTRAIAGLKAKGLADDDRYRDRLLYELGMIRDKGLSPYFLIMEKITSRVRAEMLIGPGRGSAGGSLVCYLLGITNIDPIEHGLMFERFINVDRNEPPDVDLDFQDVDRVKEIMGELYGKDNVACISTYGTSQIKGVLKDVCRVFDVDHVEVNSTNAKIDKELQAIYKESGEAKSAIIIKLDDVYRLSPTFVKLMKAHPDVERHVKRIYGRVHHVGRHASGVVIGDDLPGETALFTSKGVLQASYTDGVVSKNLSTMGMIKFDILGLATLSIIDQAIKSVYASQRERELIEVTLDDGSKRRFELNQRVKTQRGFICAKDLNSDDTIN